MEIKLFKSAANRMDLKEKVDGGYSLTVGGDLQGKIGMKHAMEAGQEIHLKSGMKIVLEAGMQLTLKGPGGFVDIGPAGVTIQGILVNINSGGAAGAGSGSSPQSPKDPEPPDKPKEPQAAATAKPGEKDQPPAAPTPPTPVVYSPAAAVLQSAAQDGTPFCEECARAAQQAEEEEEVPVITRITWLDGADDKEVSDAIQWVNLPSDDKWVDANHEVHNKDRLGQKARFKVTFSKPGSHPFKVTPVRGDENVEYSNAEKGRNAKFKWMDQEKQYTTDADGTKIVEADFFTACAGADTFKLVATDENNNPEVETGWLRTGRLVYAVPIIMHGVSTAANLDTFKREFADRGIIFEELREVEIEPMANIGPDESDPYQQRCKTAFDGSDGKQKVPYAIGIGFTGHLAVKNPNQTLELTGVTVGPDEDPVDIPVMARGLLAGDGLNRRSLWKDLVPGEGWFVSGSYIPDGGGPAQNILEASCTALPEGDQDCSGVLVDVSSLPAGTGTIRLQVNVVDRMRGGLTFPGGNLICICTKAWWQGIDQTEQNATAVHEAGHKVGDGTGKLPDKVATQYSNKGHVGNHCYYDLPVMDSYVGAEHSQCVMFGEAGDHPPTAFCPNCAPAVRKMDLSEGWTL